MGAGQWGDVWNDYNKFLKKPSFAIPSCGHRKVVISRLTNPVVNLDFYLITNRGKKFPVGAEDFTSFLKRYIARWAGQAGVL